MKAGNEWEKDELLADMEQSIRRAMDARMNDLTGALLRLNGSARGWCELSDCGECPLAPMMCMNGMEERVDILIKQFHAGKNFNEVKAAIQKPLKRAIKPRIKTDKPKISTRKPTSLYNPDKHGSRFP